MASSNSRQSRKRRAPRAAVFLAASSIALFAAYGPARAQTVAAAPLPSDTVTIEAQRLARQSLSGGVNDFSTAPLARTPLAVDVLSVEDLVDRGVNSLSSAVRGETSVGDDYNTFGYVEGLQIRGFVLDEVLNYRRDGMPVSSHVPVALENKEAIEILKGLSGIIAGSSAPGGLVDYRLKRPTDSPLRVIRAEISERGSALVHGDFGGRAGEGDRLGYRINVAAEERRPPIDNAWARRAFASGYFDWRAAPDTLLELEFEHQRVRQISVPGYGLLDTDGDGIAETLPPPIDPRINLNAQPWTQPFESTATTGSVRIAQRLGPAWDAALRLGIQRSVANDRIAFPDGCSSGPNYVYPGLCGNYDIDIYDYISDGERRNTNDADARLHGRFVTGPVDHEPTFGLRVTRYDERYPPFQAYNFAGTVNVFAPVALPPNAAMTNPNVRVDLHIDELSATDVLRFAQRWSVWLGARLTRLDQSSALTQPDASGGLEDVALAQHFFTPFGAVGYEPWADGFVYLSGGSGVETATVPNRPDLFVNPGQALPALRSRQVELGFKQTRAGVMAFNAALFQIEKPFPDDIPQPGGLALRVAGARVQRHRGLELDQDWIALPNLRLKAAMTLLQAETTQAVNGAYVGRATVNVPHVSATLRDTWDPPGLPGLAWSNQLVFSGHKPVLPDASVDLPAYWQWDTALRYRVQGPGSAWTWRAGIDNVTDRRYWREAPTAPWGATYLFPAMARTARLGVEVSF
jgi:iron complex outermembrane receptor protein